MKYVLISANDGTLLGGGIYEGQWGTDFIKVSRNDNEIVMINIAHAATIHFFKEPPEVLLNYMKLQSSTASQLPSPLSPPGMIGVGTSRIPPLDVAQEIVEQGPPGYSQDRLGGVSLDDLPLKLPRKGKSK
jgi:hypothetical protein